ncbi:MAG: hypothetical protein B9S33_02405 [Pedosphaera sp. Tous-C6FEB]|nr:MAG: hypothetical protein B9S33_02405 [Pedosphaera sp. Tous-C6FEB]
MNSIQPLLDSPLFDLLAQSSGASATQKAAAAGFSIVIVLVALFFAVVTHFVMSFFLKRICEKAGTNPGVMIWIPIAQLVPLLETAKLPLWHIVLFFIPLVNIGAAVFLFWKLCEARSKPGALALLLLVPGVNLGLILYLAFAD